MAKYAISAEGAEGLRLLAQKALGHSSAIEEAGETLKAGISGLSELGIYEDQILELINEVDAERAVGSEAVENVAALLNKKAEEVDELVNAGLA